jgi:autotransporter-associated beta strand protein
MNSRRSSRFASLRKPRAATTSFGAALLAAGSLLGPITPSLSAATQVWNIPSGDWDTTSANWSGSTWTNGNDASFTSAANVEIAGLITVSGIASTQNLTFNDTIPGGTITLIGASPFINAAGQTLTFNVAIAGTTGFSVTNPAGEVVLNASNSVSGPVSVNSGTLRIAANGALNDINLTALGIAAAGALVTTANNQISSVATVTNAGSFTLGGNDTIGGLINNGGTINGPGRLSASTYALNNNSVINANLGNGAITANGAVAVNGSTGTGSFSVATGTTTLAGASSAAVVNVATASTLATTATGSLSDSAVVTLTGTGTHNIGQNDTIARLVGAGTVGLGGNTLTLANGAGASSAAAIGGTGGVTLSSGTQTLSGTSGYTGNTTVNGGTLALTGSLTGSNSINVATGALLTSTGGLANTATVTLSGSGALTLTGSETLANLSGSTGSVTATGVDLAVTGTLATSGNITVRDLTVGILDGSSFISSSGNVTVSSGNFAGNISSGALVKTSGSTLTLTGTNNSTAGTTVDGGILALGHATNTLSNTGALTVNAGATVDLGANTDTVGSYTSNGGTLAGTGTLTAATYALNNNTTVNAKLGDGTITANGAVGINGTTGTGSLTVESGVTTLAAASGATSVSVTGGDLTLTSSGALNSATTISTSAGAGLTTGGADQLGDTVAITNGGTLTVGGADTVGSLNNTGVIAGSGVLTTADALYTLATGSSISGKLGDGTVNVTGDTAFTGTGTSAAATVNVNAGVLTLGGTNLLDSAVVTNFTEIALTGDDTVGSLINTGTVSGTGVLTAATYDLGTGSIISGKLGAGAVTVTGDTDITGTAASTTILVNSGVILTLSGNNLADTTAVTNNGTLTLNGNDTIGSLVNNEGATLDGAGLTLTAATYELKNNSVVNVNLGAGAITTNGTVSLTGLTGTGSLTVKSGVTTLDNTSFATNVLVEAGSLVLTSNAELNSAATIGIAAAASLTTGGVNQLANTAAVTNNGTFTLGASETIGSLVNNGGIIDSAGLTLSALTYALNDASVINVNLGDGALTANGIVTVNGTTGAGSITVESGTTTLTKSAAASDVNVTGGNLTLTTTSSLNSATTIDISLGATLNTAADDQLGNAAVLTNAGILTLGGNDTVASLINSGTIESAGLTLTAATSALNDGSVVNANLGDGSITANGIVAINGTTGTGSLEVQSGTTTLDNTSAANIVLVTGGALTLTANGTLNSATTIITNPGTTLTTAADQQLGDSASVLLDGALNLGGNETIGDISGAGSVALGNRTLTISNGAGGDFSGIIDGTGALILTTGDQILSGPNTYTGNTTVSGGTLTLDGTSQSAALLVTAGTLNVNALSAATTATIDAGAFLTTGAAEVLNDNLVVTANGTLTIGGVNETIGGINGSGSINLLANNSLTLQGNGQAPAGEITGDFSGTITGTGQIIKNGTDVQILSGANDFSGIATINAGVLRVTNASALGVAFPVDTANTIVNSGGTLQIAGGISINEVVLPKGLGADDTSAGPAFATLGAINSLSGNNTLTGQIGLDSGVADTSIAVSSGTFTISGDIVQSAGNPFVKVPQVTFQTAEGTTLIVTGNTDILQFDGLADIRKTGAGTLDLTNLIGNNSSGDVYINEGTVLVQLQQDDNTTDPLNPLGGLGGVDGITTVHFGDTDRGILRIASLAPQSAIVAGGGEFITGGDGDFAEFRSTTFDFTSGDGTIYTEADTVIRRSNLQNFSGQNLIKSGDAALLIDMLGGSLVKDVPAFRVNSGSVFFLSEAGSSLTLGGLDGPGGTIGFGPLNVTVNQVTDGTFGGDLDGTGDLTINATNDASLVASGVLSGFNSVTIGGDSTGDVTLSGNSTYTGPTNIVTGGNLILSGTSASLAIDIQTGASLTLTASDRITDAATVTNAGLFDLGANSDTVATYTSNNGTLSGNGTLTAATYNLNNGTVINANLGDGDLVANDTVQINGNTGNGTFTVQTGTTTLAGSSSALTVQIDTAGSLITTADERLSDNATVTITGAGLLTLGGNETTGRLAGTGGTVDLGNRTLTLSDGADASSAASIIGTGGLSLTSGNQTLSGNSSYSGPTNVNGGILALTGNLVSNVVNVAPGAALSTTGGLADDTALTLTGNGTATFTGDETLASLAGSGAVTALNLTVGTLNGNATINSSALVPVSDGDFSGNLATGALTKTSNGTLTLSGQNATPGPIIVNQGTLALANATNTLADNAALTLNAGAFINIASNTDTVGTFTNNGGTLNGNGTLSATTYTLTDGAVINANLGNGTATALGLVRLNASTGTGTFTVLNGGELRGVGMVIGGDLIVDLGGIIAPGGSPGIATVVGDWIHNGSFAAELAGTGGAGAVNGHDQIVVGGSIALNPATSSLDIQRDGLFVEPARADAFRVVVGDLTGQQFAFVTSEFSTGLVLDLVDGTLYGTGLTALPGLNPSKRVDLTQFPGLNTNSQTIIGAIQGDAFADDTTGGIANNNGVQFRSNNGSGAVIKALVSSPAGAVAAANAASPESFAGESDYAIRATRNYAETALSAAPVIQTSEYSIFAAYTGMSSATSSSQNQADYDLASSGGVLGASAYVGADLTVGAFIAIDSGSVDSTYRKADMQGFAYGLFAEYNLNEERTLALTAGLSLGTYDSDSSRASAVAGGPRALTNGVNSSASGFALGLRYDAIKTADYGLSPYIGVNYSSASSDRFTETGALDAMAVQSIDYTSFQGELGARGYVMVTEKFSLTGGLGLAQEFGDDESRVTARIASGTTPFTVTSPGFGATSVSANIGVNYAITKALSVGAGYKASLIADGDTASSVFIGGGVKF